MIFLNDQIQSLKTGTPEEGFRLAIRLAQKTVGTIQPDAAIRRKLRPKYSRNADSLIAASLVAATYFQTVAAANNYWGNPSYKTAIRK